MAANMACVLGIVDAHDGVGVDQFFCEKSQEVEVDTGT